MDGPSLVGAVGRSHLPPPILRAARAFAPALAWALVIWLIGGAERVPSAPPVPGIDKIAHFAMYGVLGWLAGRGWMPFGGRARAVGLIVLALLLGAADELRQAGVPGRSADALDWVADAAGTITGFLLAVRRARRRQRHEHASGDIVPDHDRR